MLHLDCLVLQTLSLISPRIIIPPLSVVTIQELTTHIGYLVAAVPSSSFLLNHEGEFSLRPGLTLSGVSPESLEAYLQQFIRTGNLTKRLEVLLQEPGYKGKVVEGFKLSVRNYLRVFTNSAIAISQTCSDNLGELSSALSPLISQVPGKLSLRFNNRSIFAGWISRLCQCGPSRRSVPSLKTAGLLRPRQ